MKKNSCHPKEKRRTLKKKVTGDIQTAVAAYEPEELKDTWKKIKTLLLRSSKALTA